MMVRFSTRTSWLALTAIKLGIAWGLRRENKRRDRLTASGEIRVEKFYDENGQEVDATFLDLTDVRDLTMTVPEWVCD